MKVALDANIMIDMILDRVPFADDARAIVVLVRSGKLRAALTATTITNVHYIVRKHLGLAATRQAVEDLLALFEICPVDKAVLQAAWASPIRDFEDAVQDAAAHAAGYEVLVTRNGRDFAGAACRVVDPVTFLGEVRQGRD